MNRYVTFPNSSLYYGNAQIFISYSLTPPRRSRLDTGLFTKWERHIRINYVFYSF